MSQMEGTSTQQTQPIWNSGSVRPAAPSSVSGPWRCFTALVCLKHAASESSAECQVTGLEILILSKLVVKIW